MSSSIWKLNALIKKNLLEMKRNVLSTLCEIFFPIILMILLYWLKTIFDIKLYEFDETEGKLEDFIKERSVTYLDNYTSLPSNTTLWNGMSIRAALRICSIINSNQKERPKIATIGVPDEIKWKLVNDSLIFDTSSGVPVAIILPPKSPPSGPRSII